MELWWHVWKVLRNSCDSGGVCKFPGWSVNLWAENPKISSPHPLKDIYLALLFEVGECFVLEAELATNAALIQKQTYYSNSLVYE